MEKETKLTLKEYSTMKYIYIIFVCFSLCLACDTGAKDQETLLRIEKRLEQIEKKLALENKSSDEKKAPLIEEEKTLTPDELENYIEQIERGHMPNEKLTIAKRLCRNISLESHQVRDIVSTLFSTPTKMSFAKFAYRRTIDKENYNLVVELFHFMHDNELQNFIDQEN